MEMQYYLKFFAALLFVLSLMGGLAFILKRFGIGQGGIISPIMSKTAKRLKIVEILPLDARRKAVLIQRDDTQHLVLLSATGESVIETNIKAPKEAPKKKRAKEKNASSKTKN